MPPFPDAGIVRKRNLNWQPPIASAGLLVETNSLPEHLGGVLLTILLNVILPIFLVGGCGFLVGRRVCSEPTMLIRTLFLSSRSCVGIRVDPYV